MSPSASLESHIAQGMTVGQVGYVFQRTATRPHAKGNLLTIPCSSFAEQSVVVVIVVHLAFLLPRHLEMNFLCTLTRMTIFIHLVL